MMFPTSFFIITQIISATSLKPVLHTRAQSVQKFKALGSLVMLASALISDFTSTLILTAMSVDVSVSTGMAEEKVVSINTVTLLLLHLTEGRNRTICSTLPGCSPRCTQRHPRFSFGRAHSAAPWPSACTASATVNPSTKTHEWRRGRRLLIDTEVLNLKHFHRYVLADVDPFQHLSESQQGKIPPCQKQDQEYLGSDSASYKQILQSSNSIAP